MPDVMLVSDTLPFPREPRSCRRIHKGYPVDEFPSSDTHHHVFCEAPVQRKKTGRT